MVLILLTYKKGTLIISEIIEAFPYFTLSSAEAFRSPPIMLPQAAACSTECEARVVALPHMKEGTSREN